MLVSLNIVFLLLVLFVFFFVSRRSISIFFLWGTLIIFVVPFYYTVLGGETYRSFGEEIIYPFYLNAMISMFLVFLVFLILVFVNGGKKFRIEYFKIDRSKNIEVLSSLVFCVCLAYFLYYFNQWPLLKVLSGADWERPDIVKGGFKGFFLMSVVYQVMLPAIFFYFYQRQSLNKFWLSVLFVFVSFFLIVGGNKGIYLYFILFFLFIAREKIPIIYMVAMAFFLVFFYAMMKGVAFDYETFVDYIFESAFRRIFVTQGMATPNAIQMYYDSVDFSLFNSDQLKYALFYKIYGYTPGSMPLYFTVEAFVRFGYLGLFSVGVSISVLAAVASYCFERLRLLSVSWCGYYLFYVLIMSGMAQSNLYRAVVVFSFAFILVKLSKGATGDRINNNANL